MLRWTLLLLLAAPLPAGEPETLVETTAIGNPQFATTWGTVVERSDDVLVVARDGFPGSVSVFREVAGAWTFEQELTPSDGFAGDSFGRAVDVSGDVIVVGAPNADSAVANSGAAYVFRHDGAAWIEEAKLFPNDVASPGSFTDVGVSVAVDDDTVLVGATSDFAVWEYAWDGATWQQVDRFGPPPGSFSFFGWRLAFDGERALVYDFFDAIVYVYRRDVAGWVEEGQLFVAGFSSDFGRSMDLDGETIVVGAPEPDGQGSAFVYRLVANSWTLEQELVPPNTFRDSAGFGVAVEGSAIVVGAPLTSGATNGSGAAFLYRRAGGWTLEAKLVQGSGLTGDRFGTAVDVLDGEAFVSATSAGLPFTGPGTVYVYDVAPDGPWFDLGQGLAGQAGVPTLSGSGTLVGGDPVTLTLANAAALAPATLVVGFTELGAPFKGGVLVPSPDLVVSGLTTPLVIASTWPVGVPSGFSTVFQVWIADPFGPAGFAASNGLQGVTP